jgi:hypothetical protein
MRVLKMFNMIKKKSFENVKTKWVSTTVYGGRTLEIINYFV